MKVEFYKYRYRVNFLPSIEWYRDIRVTEWRFHWLIFNMIIYVDKF